MSAPVLWIAVPGLLAILLYSIRRWSRLMHSLGFLFALAMAWMAWQLPLGEAVYLGAGLPPLIVEQSAVLLGRLLVLDDALRPALLMIYLGTGLWFGGAYVARTPRIFIPLSLGIAALLTASLAVRPALFAVTLIEIAVLCCIPILSPPGRALNRGALRFLSFETIGMCLILYGDWLFPTAETAPGDMALLWRATILLGLGFVMISAFIPFHTWAPMLAEQAHPYSVAFIFYIFPIAVSFLGLKYLGQYTSVGTPPSLFTILRLAGGFLVLVGGVSAAFERHLGRILGFAALVQVGMSILAISLSEQGQTGSLLVGVLFAQRIPQGIGLVVWGMALVLLQTQVESLRYRSVQGLARRMPIAAASLVLANLSVAGLPVLASFPANLALWLALAQRSQPAMLMSLVGSVFLCAAGLRTLAVLVMSQERESWRSLETGTQRLLLVVGWVIFFVVGLMPQWFFPYLTSMAHIFTNPGP